MIKLDLVQSVKSYDITNFTQEQQDLLRLLFKVDAKQLYTTRYSQDGVYINPSKASLTLLQKEDEHGRPVKIDFITEQQKEQLIEILLDCHTARIDRIICETRETCKLLYLDTQESGLTEQESNELTALIKYFHNVVMGDVYVKANIDSGGCYCEKMIDYIIENLPECIINFSNFDEYKQADAEKWKRMIELLGIINAFFYEQGIMVIIPIKE